MDSSRSSRLRSRKAADRASAFGSDSTCAMFEVVAAIEAFAFSSFESPASPVPAPRLRPSQSLTHAGTGASTNARLPSTRIHISASECLQGNLRLGQVHLYPASPSETTTR